ncbi:hypothetical protein LMG31506_02264 [Cupriavidus yeoncheonensis]|uniref:Lipoprotein n=1 Tax=Cupriavidus yeoncheonensis TaxID=1462994 RepID=A0A916MUY6_9BURK|nr:hypothetical protein [Cupriavidus yeoncheonensis]CAG2140257.1 hypothetical protein LMG31506_02264 [Cupriavidus yeoncheonensis]
MLFMLRQRALHTLAFAAAIGALGAGCAAPSAPPATATDATKPASPTQGPAQSPTQSPTGPQGARGTPEGCQADKLGDDSLVGKTEAEAAAMLQGCAWRLGERDGQQYPGTMDYNPQRRTLGITSGKVAWVRRG